MQTKGQTGAIIAASIGIIVVALAVLPLLYGFVSPMTSYQTKNTESIAAITTDSGTHTFAQTYVSGAVVHNATYNENLTTPAKYNISGQTLTIYRNGTWYVDYSYQDSSYLTASGDRTIMSTVTTFIILALLLAAIGATGLYVKSRD